MQVTTPGTAYIHGAPELVLHSRNTGARLTLTEHRSSSYTHGTSELVLHSRNTGARLTLTEHHSSSYTHGAPELVYICRMSLLGW